MISHFDPREIERARRHHRLADLLQRDGVKLIRRGDEFVGLCPFHTEKTPSFTVVDKKGFYHCFGCGAHGDPIDWLIRTRGLSFTEAVAALLGATTLSRASSSAPAPTMAATAPGQSAKARRLAARHTWLSSDSIGGTPGEAYFRNRGITDPLPGTLRFNSALRHPTGVTLPGIVAAVQDLVGRIIAVHRIFLDIDGDRVSKTARKPDKALLGSPKGGAVRLAPAAVRLGLAEGIETGLAVRQAVPELSVWAAISASRLPAIDLPPETLDPIVLADRDPVIWTPGPMYGERPGEYWAQRAAEVFREQGRRPRIAVPDGIKADFNDLLVMT